MMLTIPSNKPQIHYTMCKMEKNPTLHNRYIVIIIGFRTPNQNYFFFPPQLFCKQFSPNPVLLMHSFS